MKKIIIFLVVVVFVLLSVSYLYLGMKAKDKEGWFVDEDKVRGSALIANNLNYTFSYTQQKEVLLEINDSKKVKNLKPQRYAPSAIESILIYIFDQKEPLKLIPISNDYRYFKVSTWEEPYYLHINRPQDLKIILEQAYDK